MSISIERQATLANGLFILLGAIIASIPETHVFGLCCTGMMGFFQIFSGITGYCGWVQILPEFNRRFGSRSE